MYFYRLGYYSLHDPSNYSHPSFNTPYRTASADVMEFVTYTDWNQLPESADALFLQAEKESFFFSQYWFENLHKTTLKNWQNSLLTCVVEGGSVMAILPLIMDSNKSWHSLSNHKSSLYTLLLSTNNNRLDILACLAQGLHQLPFQELKLEPIAENDRNMIDFQQALESSGFDCHQHLRFFNWFHHFEGQSFEDYMADRPSKVRNTIARKQRKLTREHNYDIHLFQDTDLKQAMTDYQTIFKASWKSDERFEGFIEGLVDTLAKPGWLRLGILTIEDKPVAAQIWFVAHGKANIFRLVYDEAWKHYSPGSILTHYLMKHVIETDKVKEIDFLTGNENYKQDWMSARRKRWGLTCVKKSEPTPEKQNHIVAKLLKKLFD